MTGSRPRRTRTRRVLSIVWALLPILYGLPAPLVFAFAAWRLRSRTLVVEAGAYFVAVFSAFVLMGNKRGAVAVGGVLMVAVVLVATARALVLRRRVFFSGRTVVAPTAPTPGDGTQAASGPRSASIDRHDLAPWRQVPFTNAAPTPEDWTPVFPGSKQEPVDPHDPATWAQGISCTGDDSHLISIPARRLLGSAFSGAVLLAADLRFHLTGHALGVAIALLCSPLIAALFARRVDGATLTYRTWGVKSATSLWDVIAVDTGKTKSTLVLAAAGRKRPLRINLRGRSWLLPPGARDHLEGWLRRPGVRISPSSDALLRNDPTNPARLSARRRRRMPGVIIMLLGPVLGATPLLIAAVLPSGGSTAIAGAPGYATMPGPDGHALPVGEPWGRPCAPVVLMLPRSISPWMQGQVDGVVSAARSSGVDVTVTAPEGLWNPQDLYPSGLSDSSVEFVPLTLSSGPPGTVPANGGVAHSELDWNTGEAPDLHHATITWLSEKLYTQAIGHDARAARRAIRQVIAASQGVLSTTRTHSGIADGSRLDAFSTQDLAAMRVMSGCPA